MSHKVFVTKRRSALPTDAGAMADKPWFNMWQHQLWPYNDLEEGVTLYWYDNAEQAIVWQSRVAQVMRSPYANKNEVRKSLEMFFGVPDLKDPYFDKANDQGYCLAYKLDSLVRFNVRKPAEFKFPGLGWLRCSEVDAAEWLKNLPASVSPDGSSADELLKMTTVVAEAGYFSPASLNDEREKKLREIVQRRGQLEFRNKLVAAYQGQCVVTGCNAVDALEAAHIVPYTGPLSNDITNGLLLRADIHTLLDLDLIGIHPKMLTVALGPVLKNTNYSDLEGKLLAEPNPSAARPNTEALDKRWHEFKTKCN